MAVGRAHLKSQDQEAGREPVLLQCWPAEQWLAPCRPRQGTASFQMCNGKNNVCHIVGAGNVAGILVDPRPWIRDFRDRGKTPEGLLEKMGGGVAAAAPFCLGGQQHRRQAVDDAPRSDDAGIVGLWRLSSMMIRLVRSAKREYCRETDHQRPLFRFGGPNGNDEGHPPRFPGCEESRASRNLVGRQLQDFGWSKFWFLASRINFGSYQPEIPVAEFVVPAANHFFPRNSFEWLE